VLHSEPPDRRAPRAADDVVLLAETWHQPAPLPPNRFPGAAPAGDVRLPKAGSQSAAAAADGECSAMRNARFPAGWRV